jgi:ParB family chromosome partitioning protein
VALVENLMREDLNPVEEAQGYRALMEQFSMTQEQISARIGRSRSAVANALRLLALPEEVLRKLERKELSAGHARALLALPPKEIASAAGQVLSKGLSVRETEQLVKKLQAEKPPAAPPRRAPTYFAEMQLALQEQLGRRVRITSAGKEKGTLSIEFYSSDELRALGEKLAK